jgi:hypothetical protein
MKFKLFFLIPTVFIFFNLSISQAIKKDTTQDKKFQLVELEKKRESLKKEKEKFLKLYITFYIKRLYNKGPSDFFKNSNYLTLLNEEERFKFIEKALTRKILSIEKEEKAIAVAYNKILKDIKKEKLKVQKVQKFYAVNPLNGEPIELGNHILKTKGPLSIVTPIAGIIKGIGYKQNNIHIIIENEQCKATILGLDEVVVNVGDRVLRNQIIGNVKGEKNLSFSVNCEKAVSSSPL